MENQSLKNIAFELLEKRDSYITFQELYGAVCKKAGLDEIAKDENIGQFYTDLTVDGRFVLINENNENYWDLRTKHPFDIANPDYGAFEVEELFAEEFIEEEEEYVILPEDVF